MNQIWVLCSAACPSGRVCSNSRHMHRVERMDCDSNDGGSMGKGFNGYAPDIYTKFEHVPKNIARCETTGTGIRLKYRSL